MVTRVGASALWDGSGDVAAAAAAAGDAIDLRVAAADGPRWRASGWTPLGPGVDELVLPLPQATTSADATRALGRRLAGLLRAGDLVVLSGRLGAGKTALTQGIASGLGVSGPVTSPTFVLARVHDGPVPLVHVDAYRLRDAGAPGLELDGLDLDASLPDSVTVVEWGDGLVEGLADSRLDVHLDRSGPDDDLRMVTVRALGLRWSVTAPARQTQLIPPTLET